MTVAALPFFAPDMFEDERFAILELVREVALDERQRFILGRRVEELERRIAERAGVRSALACASGTGALAVAAQALEIGPGDEVVVPAFCCQPVASVVADAGATPVFADVDATTMTIDPVEVAERMSRATKAIVAAHVFSVMADMPAIAELARARGVALIEDAAVAQGATLRGRPAGAWGDVGVLSFFQAKALGAVGEGGMVLTSDASLAARCGRLRNHGQDAGQPGIHLELGQSSRMDELIAGFLLHRLDGVAGRLRRRAEIAAHYSERLAPLWDHGVVLPPSGSDGRCYYVYCLLTDRRDDLRRHLAAHGIGTHVYYPLPLPAQPGFRAYAGDASYPRAEAAGRRNVALPIYPHLRDADVERIADTVAGFFETRARRVA